VVGRAAHDVPNGAILNERRQCLAVGHVHRGGVLDQEANVGAIRHARLPSPGVWYQPPRFAAWVAF
jgi:hypothetical protein